MAYDDAPNPFEWSKLIKAVKTPLSFFTLALLIAQGFMAYLLARVTTADQRVTLYAMLIMTFLLVGLVAFLQYRKTTEREFRLVSPVAEQDLSFDVFLSVPMAALSHQGYEAERKVALELVKTIEADCNMKSVFYAGGNIEKKSDFDPCDASVKEDLDAIGRSKYFLMIYPKKLPSSVLFEAGCALALGKKCIYFVQDRRHLPFLMQEAEQAFSNIKLYRYTEVEDIKKTLRHRNTFQFKQS